MLLLPTHNKVPLKKAGLTGRKLGIWI